MLKVAIHQGHVLEVLKDMAAESVQCVVTSPPYWGLRDYGLEPQVWMLPDTDCPGHEWGHGKNISRDRQHLKELGEKLGCLGGNKHSESAEKYNASTGQFCRLCGAWRGSYGLEPMHDCLGWATRQPCGQCYICHTVEIFRELWRVLRKDGVLFLNLGDSYHGGGGAGGDYNAGGLREGQPKYPGRKVASLKPKDLCGIPWRVALALQADGWWLRSDIIWSKPNPMPESCQDRPTRAHEYIFLLTKSAKYFWDQEAVREPNLEASIKRDKAGYKAAFKGRHTMPGEKRPHSTDHNGFNNPGGRNLRSVWEMATAPFPDAHFATFPPELVRRCVAAGTSEKGCCPECGAPWEKVVEKKSATMNIRVRDSKKGIMQYKTPGFGATNAEIANYGKEEMGEIKIIGWKPTCACKAGDPIPCTVLDPFAGSGTTGLVAAKMERNAVLIELKPEYCRMAEKRIKGELGMLIEIDKPGESA